MFDFRGFDFEKALSRLNIYTGIFLTELQRNFLLRKFPPKHPNVYADHATLCFQPDAGEVDKTEVIMAGAGEVSPTPGIMVTHYAEDDKGQVVGVEIFYVQKDLKLTQDFLHITISCANGTSPVYSNKLKDKLTAVESVPLTGFYGICRHTDRNVLPRDMWKRRGLNG